MSFNLKQASDELLKVAAQLDKEASEKTIFVCNTCGHTASLASVNACRVKMASSNKIEKVKAVTVEDKISCGAVDCSGVMSYTPTQESERYYVEAADENPNPLVETPPEEEDTETPPAPPVKPEGEETPSEATPPEEGEELDESIFEPVDEQEAKNKPPAEPEGDEAPKSEGSEPSFEETPKPLGPSSPSNDDELMPEEKPDQGKPQDIKEEPPAEEPSTEEPPAEGAPAEGAPSEEPPAEESPVDSPDIASPPGEEETDDTMGETPEDKGDEEGEVPEEGKKTRKRSPSTTPKFTEMPEEMKDLKLKTASARFWSSVARYTLK
jgi:hypothetical protein